MKEIMLVAERCGVVGVREDLDEVLMKQVLGLKPIKPSMLVDVHEGRVSFVSSGYLAIIHSENDGNRLTLFRWQLLEVDVIFGSPLKMARQKGVDVPTLEIVYAILTGINTRLMQGSSSASN